MSSPFVGEIRLFGCNFAPRGYAECAGQLMAISQNTALFSLLGTFYGGNGTSNFALPDLRGRAIQSFGQSVLGEQDGVETVTVSLTQYPLHTHAFNVHNGQGAAGKPGATRYMAATQADPPSPPPPPPPPPLGPGPNLYGAATHLTALIPNVLAAYAGGQQPHENRQPCLAMEYVIALTGIFPARN
jgi:microcystin-dependent protein